jgi:hypothetical protein
MKTARIMGLEAGQVWAVGMRYMLGEERPHNLSTVIYELLDDRLVRLTVPTREGTEFAFVLLHEPMTAEELYAETHGRGRRAVELLPARGNA